MESEVEKIVNNIVTNANNALKLSPQFYLSPEIIDYAGKKIIYVYVPESSQVHRTAGKIFDRNARDGDIDITNHHNQVTQLYIRKQQTYSENHIYPALQLADFRSDLLQRVRTLVRNQRLNHPWLELEDKELMQSAGLYIKDYQSGQEGFTLAAVLLLGKDEVLHSILPHYKIDAIVRIHNIDRYDDRDDIRTNLLESYDRLMTFIAKHLTDRFYQEGTQRISLRDRIFREVVGNLLVHREFINPFPAKLIVESDKVITENSNRPHGHGLINPASFSPYPKNPVIAKFFKEIGWVDELGSGVRNTFKYTPYYSHGKMPAFDEGDVFRCVIPLEGVPTNQVTNQDTNQVTIQVEEGKQLAAELKNPPSFERWLQILENFLQSGTGFSTQNLEKYTPMLEGFLPEWEKVLAYCQQPKSRKDILEKGLGLTNQTYNFKNYVEPLLEQQLLRRTIPNRPQSPQQKYFTTERGNILLHLLERVKK